MKGDFSRDTFSEAHRFTRVLMQQGRVQLDADWNEQASILLHFLQSVTADLVGRFGGPAKNLGYTVTPTGKGDFSISPGHYYVDGLLCENRAEDYTDPGQGLFYTRQKDLPQTAPLKAPDSGAQVSYLVYLDAWERHLTYVVDETLREYALNGADTASRARLETQVKVTTTFAKDKELPSELPAGSTWKAWLFNDQSGTVVSPWDQFVAFQQPADRGLLKATGRPATNKETDVCLASPDGRYRGAENQLYRVEIHRGGSAWDEKSGAKGQQNAATFKWSRENGCVIFPLNQLQANNALIEKARDDRLSLHVGEWVEVVDDTSELLNQPGDLAEVVAIIPTEDPTCQQVKLRPADGATLPNILPDPTLPSTHPLLRRWDSRPATKDLDPQERKDLLSSTGGALLVEEGVWINLEDGIRIWFDVFTPSGEGPYYRTGDYWLIPARTAIEDVLWPDGELRPPNGVAHHYAPLAVLSIPDNKAESVQDVFQSMVDLTGLVKP